VNNQKCKLLAKTRLNIKSLKKLISRFFRLNESYSPEVYLMIDDKKLPLPDDIDISSLPRDITLIVE
jgi:hypothetical protein